MGLLSRWKGLPAEHRDYVFVYAAGIAWFLVYFIFSPPSTYILLSPAIIALWCFAAIIGGIVAITGLFKRDTLILERSGVIVMMVGPISYGLTQFVLLFASNFTSDLNAGVNRLHLVFLSIWLFTYLLKRLRQLNRTARLASDTPLASEEEDVAGGTRD